MLQYKQQTIHNTMPLLLLYLLFGTPQPIQAQSQYEPVQRQQLLVLQKTEHRQPCMTYYERNYTEITFCPLPEYKLLLSDGRVVQVDFYTYERQVIGTAYNALY